MVIVPEQFCEDCGYPIDQCECLYPDSEEVESENEVRDEDYSVTNQHKDTIALLMFAIWTSVGIGMYCHSFWLGFAVFPWTFKLASLRISQK